MEYVPVFILMFLVVALISWSWVRGIDYMMKNHPDYKGEDFLNWGDEEIDDEFNKQRKNVNGEE
jgi:predicted PurR-regulated permease PerM